MIDEELERDTPTLLQYGIQPEAARPGHFFVMDGDGPGPNRRCDGAYGGHLCLITGRVVPATPCRIYPHLVPNGKEFRANVLTKCHALPFQDPAQGISIGDYEQPPSHASTVVVIRPHH